MRGYVEACGNGYISGWIIGDRPNETSIVAIFADDKKIGECLACDFRQDLVEMGHPTGVGGFSFPLPLKRLRTHPHIIRVVEAHQGWELPPGPIELTSAENEDDEPEGYIPSYTSGENLDGAIDLLTTHGVSGWARHTDSLEGHVRVEVLLGGSVIASGVADEMRLHFDDKGGESGRYGYTMQFDSPLSDNADVKIQAVGKHGILVLYHGKPGVIDGDLESDSKGRANGWAPTRLGEKPLRVEAYPDGQVVASAVADNDKKAARESGGGDEFPGFTLEFDPPLTRGDAPVFHAVDAEGETLQLAAASPVDADVPIDRRLPKLEPSPRSGGELRNTPPESQAAYSEPQTSASQPAPERQAAEPRPALTPQVPAPRSIDWPDGRATDLLSVFRRRLADEQRRLNVAITALSGSETPAGDPVHWDSVNPRKNFVAALSKAIAEDRKVTKRVKDHVQAIADYFDPWFYVLNQLEHNQEVHNPILHYILVGYRDGNSPHLLFDPEFYRSQVKNLRGDPFLHFLLNGAHENLDPHPLFDTKFYRTKYMAEEPEANPWAHYLDVGAALGYDPSPFFSTDVFYTYAPAATLWTNALEAFLENSEWFDLPLVPAFDAKLYRFQLEIERGQRLKEPPLVHYLRSGYRDETLLPNLLFDPQVYREKNGLSLDEPALLHYLREGDRRGLHCHTFFSAEFFNRERGDIGEGLTALEYALANPRASYQSDHRMSGPIDPNLIEFLRKYVEEWGESQFDLSFYRSANSDLRELGDEACVEHYFAHGRAEGRIASPTDLMRNAKLQIRELSLGFVSDEYAMLSPDLNNLKGDFVAALNHFALAGRNEGRMYGKWQFYFDDLKLDLPSARKPLTVSAPAKRNDVCVLIHAFYPDLLPELVAFAQNFQNNSFDIFINVVDLAWTPELHEQLRAICPGAFVQLSNDSGRDIGGFTRLLRNIDLDRYDIFAFFHSKKSPHIAPERGDHWRRTLLRAIAGSPEVADTCIAMFKEDSHVGMIGAKEWRSSDMGNNAEQYERLLDLLGIKGKNRVLDYLSGFMFLIRRDIVKTIFEVLKEIDWEYGGDNVLDFHMDGQIAHGVERAVPALVRHMGYEVVYR